nr:hypothetical protein [Actinomadura darangshiensis]
MRSAGSAVRASATARPSAGPNAIPRATARLTSTTGDGMTRASISYSAAIRTQSVSSAVRGRAWQAAMAAWRANGPSAPPSRSARSSAARPRRISTRSQAARFCSARGTGSPDGRVRVRSRDA